MNISKTHIAHTTGKLLMKIYIKESNMCEFWISMTQKDKEQSL